MRFDLTPAGRGFIAPHAGVICFGLIIATRCHVVRRIPVTGKNTAGRGQQGKVGEDASERFHGMYRCSAKPDLTLTCPSIPQVRWIRHGVFP